MFQSRSLLPTSEVGVDVALIEFKKLEFLEAALKIPYGRYKNDEKGHCFFITFNYCFY